MEFIVQEVIPYILAYKYLGLLGISFIAAFIIPVPSGTVLMAATALASRGHFSFSLVILISLIGNLAGDSASYWMARIYGEKIFSQVGFRRMFKSKTFNQIEEKFRKHPGFIILASRFEVISTVSTNLLAGISKVSYKKFLLYESIGTVGQVFLYGSLGYVFGYDWQAANTIVGQIFLVILIILILSFFVYKKKIIAYLKRDTSLT